jgi:ABC-2 type transport system permease protein
MGLFGVAFVVRMIADSGPATRWLRWLTPFGWTELMRPFTANDLLPLVPATFAVAGLTLAAVAVAARRDAGGGALASRDMSPVRPFGLASPLGLAVRVELPVLAAWCAGAAAAGLVLGIIANVATGPVPASLGDTLDKFGVRGTLVNQYLSVAFLLLATIVALLPAGQAGDALEEETSGRLAHALVQPTHRAALFAGRLAVSGVAIGCAGVLAGVAAWGGARTQGIDLGLGSMVGAGLNLVPTALVALAVGALALAVVPRTAPRAVYVVVIGSLIGDLLGSLVPGVRWLDRVSLFHYMALAPAEHPQPRTIALTVAAAVALCALATALFDRRDVEPA